jgi:hypothetical protein
MGLRYRKCVSYYILLSSTAGELIKCHQFLSHTYIEHSTGMYFKQVSQCLNRKEKKPYTCAFEVRSTRLHSFTCIHDGAFLVISDTKTFATGCYEYYWRIHLFRRYRYSTFKGMMCLWVRRVRDRIYRTVEQNYLTISDTIVSTDEKMYMGWYQYV